MTKVKIVKPEKGYRVGYKYDVTPNIAHGLITRGVAILAKDVVETEYKTKSVKKKDK